MSLENKLAELNRKLPILPKKEFPFAMGVITGNLVFMSGQTPTVDGQMTHLGIVGNNVTAEEAREAAVICTLNLLAALKELVGDLDRVSRIVKVTGYVASTPEFGDQPLVINAVSELLNHLFGSDNKHARAAIGVASLPGGTSVEVELVAELKA